MRASFVFATCTIAVFETLRNLNGYAHYAGSRIEPRTDPLLLILLVFSLVIVFLSYPNWD